MAEPNKPPDLSYGSPTMPDNDKPTVAADAQREVTREWVAIRLRGYKLCPECGQPILKKGQLRKHPDDYRHAQGCPNAD